MNKSRTLITATITLVLFFAALSFANAAEFSLPGAVEGEGTHFAITDSSYLNVALNSAETIKLRMESAPEMVTMFVESASSAASTQIVLTGFNPNTTYYKYEDNYHNLTAFTADSAGSYSYIQDLSAKHFVFIQPRKSTKFIKDDATGGDCAKTPDPIGTWDVTTKTCVLSMDLTETIQIDSDNITLDGGGYTMTGTLASYGVYLTNKSGITIKNLNVTKFYNGIHLYFSNGNTITGNNTISNGGVGGGTGIFLWSSINNIVEGNISLKNAHGIALYDSSRNNTLIGNTTNSNIYYGIALAYFSDGNTLTGNKANLNGWSGIYLDFSNNSTITENIVSNNQNGISLKGSTDNVITDNTVNLNWNYGIGLAYSNDNNKIYNNNFIDNKKQAYVSGGSGNIFNLAVPTGGNYWANYDTSAEGCVDANYDNICDLPYVFTGGQDNLPWTKEEGWKLPVNQPPAISNLGQYKSDGLTEILEEGNTAEDEVVFKAVVADPDGDQIKLQVELKEYSQPFDETNLLESDFASSGKEIVITKDLLIEGQYKWRARAVDANGKKSAWQEFEIVGNVDFEVEPQDQIAPTTAIFLSGASGAGDWYISDVQITLSAEDNTGGTGVSKTEYSLDNGQTWQEYINPFIISEEGIRAVFYRSQDFAGNLEEAKIQEIKIDKTPPEITIISPEAKTYLNTGGLISVEYTLQDNLDLNSQAKVYLDGLEYLGNQIDSGVYLGETEHTLKIAAIDEAGNSSEASVIFQIAPQQMESFNIGKTIVFWGVDCPEFQEKLEETEDWGKESKDSEKKLPKHCFAKKNTFSIWGDFTLPENYQTADLDKSASLYLQIAGQQGKDTVVFKDLKNSWLYQEKPHQNDSLNQGIDIKTAIIYWQPEKKLCEKQGKNCPPNPKNKNWFYIRGELNLQGVDINTFPAEATIALEIPVSPYQTAGSLGGKEIIKFKKLPHIWFYHSPSGWRNLWKELGGFGFKL